MPDRDPIPFNRPYLTGRELDYLRQVLEARHLSGDGAFTRRCHALLEQITGAARALLTTSCTHALEMAALLLDVGPGDEVIVPSFTFVSTANAFHMRGARPVFVDVRADTLNLDEAALADAITPRTRAIVPVHYAGVGCAMDEINALARGCGAHVIEDNAHGLFGSFRGAPLGSLGSMATQSFHETKNVVCGEGGALLLNDRSLIERAEIIREKGTNRSKFFRGEIDKYTWVDVGSSYLPSELLAAFLCAQLEGAEHIQRARGDAWRRYQRELADWADANDTRLPHIPDECDQTFHLFYLLLPSLDARTRLIAHLKSRGVQAVFHYVPLHLSRVGRALGGKPGDCPVTERVSDTLLRLPLYSDITATEQDRVIAAIREFTA